MKKVAIYCRVSSRSQEQGQTIQSQISELRDVWKDHQIVKEYLDDGYSGELLARPELDKLRDDAKTGMFDIVSFHAVDRISRNLYHQGLIVEELKKSKIEIFIKDKPIGDSPESTFLFDILGAVAKLEKLKILERTRRGRLHKVKTKKILGYIPPFGYSYTHKTIEKEGSFTINKKEAKIVKKIFDLYIKFQSMTRVQKELALTKNSPRKADKWCRSVVSQILRNEAYTGVGYYNKHQSIEVEGGKKYPRKAKTGSKMRPKIEWLEVKFPKIIEKEKFELAKQLRLKKFKPFGKSNHFYLLSGLIRCALCQSTFTGSVNGGNWEHTYYRCTDRRKRFPNPQHCHAKHMRADRIEPAIWSAVSKAVTHPKILTAHILALADKINDKNGGSEKKQKELLQQKQTLSFKKKKLDDLYFRGLKSIENYEKQLGEFQQEENEVNEELGKIGNQMEQVIDRPLIIKNIKSFCNMAKQKIKSMDLEQQQTFLRYTVEEILLNSDTGKAKIIGHIPVKDQDFSSFFPQFSTEDQVQFRPQLATPKR